MLQLTTDSSKVYSLCGCCLQNAVVTCLFLSFKHILPDAIVIHGEKDCVQQHRLVTHGVLSAVFLHRCLPFHIITGIEGSVKFLHRDKHRDLLLETCNYTLCVQQRGNRCANSMTQNYARNSTTSIRFLKCL